MGTKRAIRIKRIYDPPEPTDGYRILIDRLWPRGVSKDEAAVDRWMREIAPSPALRKWFGHDPRRWDTFQARYRAELERNAEGREEILTLARKGPVTLLFGAKDREHNHAIVLKDVLDDVRR